MSAQLPILPAALMEEIHSYAEKEIADWEQFSNRSPRRSMRQGTRTDSVRPALSSVASGASPAFARKAVPDGNGRYDSMVRLGWLGR
jgi:hypothetical protein